MEQRAQSAAGLWGTLVTVDDLTGMSSAPELPFELGDWSTLGRACPPLLIRPELLKALLCFPGPARPPRTPLWVQTLINICTHSARLLDCHFVGMVATTQEGGGSIILERVDMWDRQTWAPECRNLSLCRLQRILKRGNLDEPTPTKLRALLRDELVNGCRMQKPPGADSAMNLLVAFPSSNGVPRAYTTLCLHPGMLCYAGDGTRRFDGH